MRFIPNDSTLENEEGQSMNRKIIDNLIQDAERLTSELLVHAKLDPGSILVVGCSTSELRGKVIGNDSSPELAEALYQGISSVLEGKDISLAAQCCEHLNRSLVVERSAQRLNGWKIVNAIPAADAGGAWATHCYQQFEDPVLVESIQAQVGLDIGDTFIGMHLMPIVVPVRLSEDHLLEAHLTAARVRPPYAGGPRAKFNPELA